MSVTAGKVKLKEFAPVAGIVMFVNGVANIDVPSSFTTVKLNCAPSVPNTVMALVSPAPLILLVEIE